MKRIVKQGAKKCFTFGTLIIFLRPSRILVRINTRSIVCLFSSDE